MSQKLAPGKWDGDKRQDAKGLLVKFGVGCLMIGAALTYLLALPALEGNVTMWSAIVALAPGGLFVMIGGFALFPDLLPFAYHVVNRIGRDEPE